MIILLYNPVSCVEAFLSLHIFIHLGVVSLSHVSKTFWYVTGVILQIFISLMIGKRTLFTYLLAVWISSCEVPINPLPLLSWFAFYFLLIMGVLYVVSTQPFVSWSMMQIPSPTLWVGFSLFYWGLLWTRVLNFNIILWFILSFNGLCFFVCPIEENLSLL